MKFLKTAIESENFLCLPSVLEIILFENNIDHINRYDIANYFGVVVPYNYGKLPAQVFNIVYSNDENKLGILIRNNSINDFFCHFELPFVETYYPINLIAEYDFCEFVNRLLQKQNYVVCGVPSDYLESKSKSKIGHLLLIYDTYIKQDKVDVFDPGPKNFGCKTISAMDLHYSIKIKNDGIWAIRRL
jgi:hypothetical protein